MSRDRDMREKYPDQDKIGRGSWLMEIFFRLWFLVDRR